MKISRKHLAVAAVILLTGGVFYTLNALTPRYADDYEFALNLNACLLGCESSSPNHADDYQFALNLNGERLASFSEVVERGVERYFNWDGRLIANTLGHLWNFLDKSYFNVVNTLIYLALILLTQYHIFGAWRPFSIRGFVAINLGYWFLVPMWGQDFLWIAAAAVYLHSTVFALAFLAVFRFAAEQNRTEQNRTEHWWQCYYRWDF